MESARKDLQGFDNMVGLREELICLYDELMN